MITAGTPPVDGWPVMVWFHSGDFNTGTPAIWDATIFVNKQKVINNTINLLIFHENKWHFIVDISDISGNSGI